MYYDRIVYCKKCLEISVVVFLLTGCINTSNKGLAEDSAINSLTEAGIEGYSTKGGKTKEISSDDSESHQMIVKMRLLQYGMSPNLEDYRDTFLVDMKNADGDIITVVVVNDGGKMKSLLPEEKQN
jgi:hypothetical protein